MQKHSTGLHVVAIDCCEHVIAALKSVSSTSVAPLSSKDSNEIIAYRSGVDIIIIGVSRYPVRRLFISDLRRVYPDVPLLILRRESIRDLPEEPIHGEFILSEKPSDDCEIVQSLRKILPLPACKHTHKEQTYDVVREVIQVITENYSDPALDLNCVARRLPMSPARLSRILNQNVGVSFRQLLRNIRIEEAKRMLASRRYSVKEVAARVGFTDSHYFSRSFKKITGFNASEYKALESLFG